MYKLESLSGPGLYSSRRYGLNGFSIWNFHLKKNFGNVATFIKECGTCRVESLPFIYLIISLLTTIGVVHSGLELLRITCNRNDYVTMWRPRKLYIFSNLCMRPWRYVGASITFLNWILLLYAIIYVVPTAMVPFIIGHFLTVIVDIGLLFFEIMLGKSRITLNGVLRYGFPIFTLAIVNCLKNIFQLAIETDNLEFVMIWDMRGTFLSPR